MARQERKASRSRRGVAVSDPMWSEEWYLVPSSGHNIDILNAWNQGYTGEGVVVTVVDDGLEHTHPDLALNYDPTASYDMNDNDPDPMPNEADPINSHGTRCAGQIAMILNNNVCGVGVAYHSRIGGIRMLDGDVTDSVEARSLSFNRSHVMVYTNSWGPDDDGSTMEGPGLLAQMAFSQGVWEGRGGKGSIFLFAAGNGGLNDNCNADGYASNIFTISINAVDQADQSPWYAEPCAASLTSTYSSGNAGQASIATVDLRGGCTTDHGGTSAASPMAAGIIALALEANPDLTWRDVQHLTVHSSRVVAPDDPGWATNGAGHRVHHMFGYGVLDAAQIVANAKLWRTVGNQPVTLQLEPITVNQYTTVSNLYTIRSTQLVTPAMLIATPMDRVERVQVHVNADLARRGSIMFLLKSPAGTESQLLTPRPNDYSLDGIHWLFTTVHHWDESPLGNWTLTMINTQPAAEATLEDWTLILNGNTIDCPPGTTHEANTNRCLCTGTNCPSTTTTPPSTTTTSSATTSATGPTSTTTTITTTTTTTPSGPQAQPGAKASTGHSRVLTTVVVGIFIAVAILILVGVIMFAKRYKTPRVEEHRVVASDPGGIESAFLLDDDEEDII